MPLRIECHSMRGAWGGDCYVVGEAGGDRRPVVIDIGSVQYIPRLPIDLRILVLTHDDRDHVEGARGFLEWWSGKCRKSQDQSPELWIPYEWSWAYRAIQGLSREANKRTLSDLLKEQLSEIVHKAVLRNNDQDGEAKTIPFFLMPGDRSKFEEHGKVYSDNDGSRNAPSNFAIDSENAQNDMTSDYQEIEPMRLAIFTAAAKAFREANSYYWSGINRKLIERTVKSTRRTYEIIQRALDAGWSVRCFSYDAGNHWGNRNPPYAITGYPDDLTIMNAGEVSVDWRTPLYPSGLLLFAYGVLTVQNQRALVTLASASDSSHAVFWSDSDGEFMKYVKMPCGRVGLHTAPHHGSENSAHDMVWDFILHRHHSGSVAVITTRSSRIRGLSSCFKHLDPSQRAATFCSSDPNDAQNIVAKVNGSTTDLYFSCKERGC